MQSHSVYNLPVDTPGNGKTSSSSSLQVGQWCVQPTLNQIRHDQTVRHLEPQLINLLLFWRPTTAASSRRTRSSRPCGRGASSQRRRSRDRSQTFDGRSAITDSARNISKPSPSAAIGSLRPFRAWFTPIDLESARRRRKPSLLVLPFTNFGPETDKYCEGLTDEVINALTRVHELRVISRTSAFAAHARGGDIADIGKSLGVTHAIEGSVGRADRRIRITARLVQVGLILSSGASVTTATWTMYSPFKTTLPTPSHGVCGSRRPDCFGELRLRPLTGTRTTGSSKAGITSREERRTASRARGSASAKPSNSTPTSRWHTTHCRSSTGYRHHGLLVPKDAFASAVWESLRALEIDDQRGESHALLGMLRKSWIMTGRRSIEIQPCARARSTLACRPHALRPVRADAARTLRRSRSRARTRVQSDPLDSRSLVARQHASLRERDTAAG